MASTTRWTCAAAPPAAVACVADELSLLPQAAAVLVRRGYDTPERARAFLSADEEHDPASLRGIDDACRTIVAHVERGSRIVVHGDYDVDGVCATAILIQRLRALGADPAWRIPRRDEGYGLSDATVDDLAARGTGLMITADCGIASAPQVARARSAGIDVVVTDHHLPGPDLPDCPILHPALGYPFPHLCAAAVAHKLSLALGRLGGGSPAHDELDLVGLATVCDVVPLVGENRRLARAGVVAMRRTRRPGLRALMQVAQLDASAVDARALGFRLGPRLNAAGRVASAEAALELVLCEDPERAGEVADELDLLNRERRDVETRILFEAEAQRATQDGSVAYVLAGDGWHPGVAGIVASRIAERHHRPTIVIGLDGDRGRGSGRSIAGFDLHAALDRCGEHLLRHGGHAAAAGVELERGRVDEFRRAFVRCAQAMLTPGDLVSTCPVDAVVGPGSLGLELAEQLEQLGPFGAANPSPRLLVPGVQVDDVRPLGAEGQHARLKLSAGSGSARAVAFRTTPRSLEELRDAPQHAVVELERSEWRGVVEARPILTALCSSTPGRVRDIAAEGRSFWSRVGISRTRLGRELGDGRPIARRYWDRRGEGVAGVAGELLQGGEPVVVVCADLSRRRAGLEQALADLAGDAAGIAACEWTDLADGAVRLDARTHLLAVDPAFDDAAVADTGPGLLVAAWGAPELDFAIAAIDATAALRPALVEVYRALREAGGAASGERLEQIVRGDQRHPRSPWLCARLLAILTELGQATFEIERGDARCALAPTAPSAPLERSATYVALAAQLERARAQFAAEARTLRRLPAAAVG